jgi:hypothetical protein
MNEQTQFHGIIGDMNPIEHDGGVVFQNGEDQSPEVVYFQGWHDDEGPRVTVATFNVEDNVLEDLTWVDWDSVASCIGMDVEELKGYAVSDNVLARAQVYESVAAHSGFMNLDSQPRELTLEEAEKEYGEFVDKCHAAS